MKRNIACNFQNKISSESMSKNLLYLESYERNMMFNKSLETFLSVCEESKLKKNHTTRSKLVESKIFTRL